MKIVCVTYARTNDISTPEDWFRRLNIFIRAWEKIAIRHKIIRLDLLRFDGHANHNGIEYFFVNIRKDRVLFPWNLHGKIRKLNPDIVMIAGLHFPVQVLQLGMRLSARTKVIAQHHAEKPFIGIKKWLQRLADRFIDIYFFASIPSALRWVKQGNISSINKVRQIMEVSSVFEDFTSNADAIEASESGHPLFLYVGRLNANKNPLIVVRAFLRLIKTYPDARLMLIYQSVELLAEIESLTTGNRNEVILVGPIPHHEMEGWYRKAAFIVSGSEYEGSGTAICEAMSLGCIPILPNIDAFLGMTNDGSCGFLYQAGNEDSLLEAIKRALASDQQAESKKSIQHFRTELSFEAIADKIQEVLDSLKSSNKDPA
jgi:glycosyltransferase involved in cell wall biosynthesis